MLRKTVCLGCALLMLVPIWVLAQDEPVMPEPNVMLGGYGRFQDAEWNDDGSTLAVSTQTGGVLLLDADLSLMGQLLPPDGARSYSGVFWQPGGSLIAAMPGIDMLTMTPGNTVTIWDVESLAVQASIDLPEGSQSLRLAWHPSGDRLMIPYFTAEANLLLLYDPTNDTTIEVDFTEIVAVGERFTVRYEPDGTIKVEILRPDAEAAYRFDGLTGDFIEETAPPERTTINVGPVDGHEAEIVDGTATIRTAAGLEVVLTPEEPGRFSGYTEVYWSNDGRYAAVEGRSIPNLVVVDLDSGESVMDMSFDQRRFVTDVAFSPARDRLLVGSGLGGVLRLYSLPDGEPVAERWTSGGVSVSLSPDGNELASVDYFQQIVRVWDAQSGAASRSFGLQAQQDADLNSFVSVAWSPDGARIATGSQNGGPVTDQEPTPTDLFIWDAATGERVQSVPAIGYDADTISRLNWSADSRVIAWMTQSNLTGRSHIGAWDTATETLLLQQELEGFAFDISLSPAGHTLLVTVLDIQQGTPGGVYAVPLTDDNLPDAPIIQADRGAGVDTGIDWHPDGTHVALLTGEGDNTLSLWRWDGDNLEQVAEVALDADYRLTRSVVRWNPAGDALAFNYSLDVDAGIERWSVDLDAGTLALNEQISVNIMAVGMQPHQVPALSWSADGATFAASFTANAIYVWR